MAENPHSGEKSSLFKRLFRVGITKSKSEIVPTDLKQNKQGTYDTVREKLPSQVQTLLKYWQNSCHDDPQTFKDRVERYQDMEMLFFNSALMSRAMDLYADETVQADTNSQIIGVEAEDPTQREFILDFFAKVGVEKFLRPTAHNVIQFGDAGWVLALNEDGVESVLPVNPYDLKRRLEFTPHEVSKQIKTNDSLIYKLSNKSEVLKQLADSIENMHEDYSTYFKTYLFGYEVGEFALPPWRFLHFRNFTSKSPFYPYGMPLFIHSVAPYRQLDAAMTLQAIGRGAKFPIDIYHLNLPNIISPTEKLDKVTEFIREFDNSGLRETKKEGITVGERIITIKDLFEYQNITPQLDLGDIGDLEMLENALIISTGLPRNLLDPNNGSFGNSGISLIQQYVPFRRKIFHIQSILLEQLTQLVKIHIVQSGRFPLKEVNFRLTMPYPESQTDRDLIGAQSDLISLASSLLDMVQAKLLPGGEPLPRDVVRAVLTKVLPYPPEEIEKWVNVTISSAPEPVAGAPTDTGIPDLGAGASPPSGGGGAPTGAPEEVPAEEPAPGDDLAAELAAMQQESTKKIRKPISRSILYEAINEAHYKVTQNKERFREGTFNGRHFYSSSLSNSDFDVSLIVESKSKKMRLQEMSLREEGLLEEETGKE